MVFVESWDEFAAAAERLLLAAPSKTRYSFKYRNVDGALVLKVTDDMTCLKYKTDQKSDLRKIEVLTMRLMDTMTSHKGDDELRVDSAPANGSAAHANGAPRQ